MKYFTKHMGGSIGYEAKIRKKKSSFHVDMFRTTIPFSMENSSTIIIIYMNTVTLFS